MDKTLEAYLRKSFQEGIRDHSIRCEVRQDGEVKFYIHAANEDSVTLDFIADGNQLRPDPEIGTYDA